MPLGVGMNKNTPNARYKNVIAPRENRIILGRYEIEFFPLAATILAPTKIIKKKIVV